MQASLRCLKESMTNLNNTYTMALMAYVFSLAGDLKTRDFLLQHLDKVASQHGEPEDLKGTAPVDPFDLSEPVTSVGSLLYWSQSSEERSFSLSVEISSYVLLAKLSGSPTTEDLGYASRIIRWLTGKQNYYGGYSSTQV